jgi:WXG100 family type VII secretion target
VAIEADPVTIRKAGQDVAAAKQDADAKLAEVRAAAGDTQSAWQGTSGTAFQQLMIRWDEESKKLTDALQGISDQLGSQGVQIEATDEEQQSNLNRYTGTLNQ